MGSASPTPGPRPAVRHTGGAGRGFPRTVARGRATGAAKPRGAGAGRAGPRSRRDSHGWFLGGQTQVAQVTSDALGGPHERDDLHLAPTARAGFDVDTELAHEDSPGDVAAAMGGRLWLGGLGHGQRVASVCRAWGGDGLGRWRRNHEGPPIGVRGENSAIPASGHRRRAWRARRGAR